MNKVPPKENSEENHRQELEIEEKTLPSDEAHSPEEGCLENIDEQEEARSHPDEFQFLKTTGKQVELKDRSCRIGHHRCSARREPCRQPSLPGTGKAIKTLPPYVTEKLHPYHRHDDSPHHRAGGLLSHPVEHEIARCASQQCRGKKFPHRTPCPMFPKYRIHRNIRKNQHRQKNSH